MAQKRVIGKLSEKLKDGELAYVKDGKVYAVKAKRGGTKGAKRKCSTKKKAATKKKVAPKKRTAPKKATARKKVAPKKTAKRKPAAKKKTTASKRQLSLFR